MTRNSTDVENPTEAPSATSDREQGTPDRALHSALLWPGPAPTGRRLGALATNSPTRYACLPSRADLRFLVPTGPGPVRAAAVRRLPRLGALPRPLRSAAVAVLGDLGLLRLWPIQLTVDRPLDEESLLQHLGTALGTAVTASARFGPPRANRKPVLELFDRNGRTRAFAKVGWNDLTAELVRREEAALRAVHAKRLDHLSAPPLLDAGTWHDLTYLLLGPVETGPTGATDDRARDRAMLELTRAFAGSAVPLSDSAHWTALRASLEALDGAGGDLASAAARLDSVAPRITVTPSAWHGDWTPWNMTTDEGTAVVWDWERFELEVPSGFDALHFAFHHAVRREGLTPQVAIRRTAARSAAILSPFGVADADAAGTFAVYLLHLGQRHARDGQDRAGAKKGPLSAWLVPAVDAVVSSVVSEFGGGDGAGRR